MNIPDKTRLEVDIESLEKSGTSTASKIVIFLLLLFLCALGAYTLSLKQELFVKEQEISLIKEKIELMEKIRDLEEKHTAPAP